MGSDVQLGHALSSSRLERFLADEAKRALIEDAFDLVEEPIDFLQPRKGYRKQIPDTSHIYLVTCEGSHGMLLAYVGQSGNLRGRAADYQRRFSVRSPDDRKLAFLQEWLGQLLPVAEFRLRFLAAPALKKERAPLETKWIKKLDPLVNSQDREPLDEVRVVEQAYRRYWGAYFEREVNR